MPTGHRSILLLTFLLPLCYCQLTCEKNEYHVTCISTDESTINFNRGVISDDEEVQELSLRNCKIVDIDPQSFDGVPNLVNLDVSVNSLFILQPGSFDFTVNLNILNLSQNSIADIPSNMFDKMISLSHLDLSNNILQQLPANLFDNNVGLVRLDLSANVLQALPEDAFKQLTELKYLNISKNALVDISTVNSLPKLVTLDLSKNMINTLPSINLPALQYLDVSSNRITQFGTSIGMNIPKKLKTFKLHRNPWQCACLEQLLGILIRRRIAYEFTAFFDGKLPVCVIFKDKANRCFRDNTKDQVIYSNYATSLMKYPSEANRV